MGEFGVRHRTVQGVFVTQGETDDPAVAAGLLALWQAKSCEIGKFAGWLLWLHDETVNPGDGRTWWAMQDPKYDATDEVARRLAPAARVDPCSTTASLPFSLLG